MKKIFKRKKAEYGDRASGASVEKKGIRRLFRFLRGKSKTWRTVMTALAVVVIFITSYGLVLPAITIEKDAAKKMPGIHLASDSSHDKEERTSGDHTKKEDRDLDENDSDSDKVSEEGTTLKDGSQEDKKSEDTAERSDDKVEYLSEPLLYHGQSYDISLSLEEEDHIPKGTVLVVDTLPQTSKDYTSCQEALKNKQKDLTQEAFFRIRLMNDGTEIKPDQPVNITIIRKTDSDHNADRGLYFRDGEKGLKAHAVTPEYYVKGEKQKDADFQSGKAGTEIVLRQIPLNRKCTLSIIGIAYRKNADSPDPSAEKSGSGQDSKADAADDDEDAEVPALAYPEASFQAKTRNLEISVEAPEGALPEGTTMRVREVAKEEVIDSIAKAIEEPGNQAEDKNKADNKEKDETDKAEGKIGKKEVRTVYAADITFTDSEGHEIEPAKAIRVTLASKIVRQAAANDDQEIAAVHLDDQGKTSLMDIEAKKDQVSFDAESFSVYALVQYTVDFHWEVDGKEFEFSIPGGGYMSFYKLMEAIGVAKADSLETKADGQDQNSRDNNTLSIDDLIVSEETRQFAADVDKLEFSSPKLLSVSKVEKDTTVGAIKDGLGLECEYSKELKEEDIERINTTEVEEGDWALISLRPFTSEESLTVTMKDGEIFTIRVTDALHVSPDQLVGKEIVIYDKTDNRALTADWEQNQHRTEFKSIEYGGEGTTTPANAHWIIEINNGNYYLKSYDGKYLKIDNTNVSLADSWNQATALTIQMGGNPDYRIYALNDDSKILTYAENGSYPAFFSTPVGSNGTGTTRTWLGIDYAVKTPDRVGDWLLYFDDDFSEITIHVGETITLRPYNKWEWKEGSTDVQRAYWNVGGKDNTFWNQIGSGDANGAHKDEWDDGGSGNNTAQFHWTAYVKKDTELVTHYWSVQGQATQTGVYYLTNTKNGKTIKVNVVDGNPVNKPATITNTADIKVNLFDYDRYFKLDPTGNTNLANNNNNKSDSTNYMSGNSHFYFLSSGSGNNNNESWNSYTNAVANPGIVKEQLWYDSQGNGYPVLTTKGTDLKYLFDTSKTQWTGGPNSSDPDGMIAYPDVNGIFQKDSDGYYYYNSNTNYFYYDAAAGKSYLYEHTYTQTSSEEKGSLVNDKPIGFFPFHDYDATANLYVNQNHNLNHHVGMSMDVDFYLPPNRLDENGKEIRFDFSGDDDLWVFVEWIDDNGNKQSKRLLDLGGIHQPVKGSINFTDNSTGLAAGKVYTLKVFYLERGGCDSNCSIKFNLPIVKDLTVAKKVNGLTPAEREKYFKDSFLYELAFRENKGNLNIDLDDENAIWSDKDQWRQDFDLYQTPVNVTNEYRNDTIYHSVDGDIKGYPVQNGQITLRNGESFTVKNLPRTEIFYVAEENQLDMQQFETPHAERLYLDANDNESHEEEVHLHQDTAASDQKTDWETKPYALMDTEKLVYTNTLQEKNLDVEKIWSDGKENHTSDPIKFKIKATVKDGSQDGKDYAAFMTEYNQTHNTSYSTNINAQWTQRTSSGTTTSTENILNKEYILNSANDWKVMFEHLPKKTQDPNGSGKEIVYTVEEVTSSIPAGYHSTVDAEAESDRVYLDLYKFWPDDNTAHRGDKAETFTVRILDGDGNPVRLVQDSNGEWRYTDKANTGGTEISFGSNSSDVMFDYAARINDLPRYNDNGSEITYTFQQVGDNDSTTTGLVMFQRPVQEIKIRNMPIPVDVTIAKVDKDNTSKTLPNAVFQMYLVNSSGNDEIFENDAFDLVGDGATAKKTGTFTITDGTITVRNLMPGRYHLKEIASPPGYIIVNADTYFTLDTNGTVALIDEDGIAIHPSADAMVELKNGAITVKNEPGSALPSTGGPGTRMIYLLGGILAIGAGLFLLSRRKMIKKA